MRNLQDKANGEVSEMLNQKKGINHYRVQSVYSNLVLIMMITTFFRVNYSIT
jgi:hypothetical protein